MPTEENPFRVLDLRLRATAKSLKKWSDRWIGNVKLHIAVALEIIFRLDKAMELRNLSEGERELRRLLKQKLMVYVLLRDPLRVNGPGFFISTKGTATRDCFTSLLAIGNVGI